MDERSPRRIEVSPAEATVDVAAVGLSDAATPSEESSGRGRYGQVALVEGSGPELTRETQQLLQGRLRLAGVLMFLACVVFLPQHILRADFSLSGTVLVLGFHVLVTVVVGVLSGLLWFCCQLSMPRLRMVEMVMFGLCAAFLAVLQHFVILRDCEDFVRLKQLIGIQQARLSLPAGLWLLVVFTYALFVPNTWRRAAVVIGILAAVPVAMLLAMILAHEEVRQALPVGAVTEFALIMAVAAVIGLFGVDTIGTLRREAFEAKQLGQYRLTSLIGAGGMGEVYLAEHQLMKRPCVVKLIRPDRAGDTRALARFQREVRATAKLSHWNTVEIFDYGSTADGTFYYVMEYLPGMSLLELVERFGAMPAARVVHFLRQACDALGEAHAMGLIHRDVKPGNIFSACRGGVHDVAKLLDFGLVKPVIEEQPIDLTTEGSLVGSPLFMSPEQITGDGSPDARSDIYSLGAVGYYLLTGRPPFEGDKVIKVVIAQAQGTVVPPSRHRPDTPADLERVILRCLSKSPDERYQDAASLGEALAGCEAADRWSREDAAAWWRQRQEAEGWAATGSDDSAEIAVRDRT